MPTGGHTEVTNMRYINKIIVHCTAHRPTQNPTVDDIRRAHQANGWRDIGYHYVVYRDGSVHPGRPVSQAGAHCYGHNNHSVGVAYVGGLDAHGVPADTRTLEQIQALRKLIVKLITMYRCDVWGHRDMSDDKNGDGKITPEEFVKECPCFNAHEEYHKYYESIVLRVHNA